MTHEVVSYDWSPADVISGNFRGHACMVLNREVRIPPAMAERLWENAYLRCTVDGGTNRWRHFLQNHCQGRVIKPPDYITGDFDSITEETSQYFQHANTKRVYTPDQNATDFTKAVGIVFPLLQEKQFYDIIVFHDTSGRIDQIMANLNTLHKMQGVGLNIYLLSGSCMTWLLRPGKHSISIPSDLVTEQRWCALMPLGQPARRVTTTGLKWDLTKAALEFGGLVSTSNTYASEEVQIETSHPLVWSMGLFSFEDN